MPQHDEVSLEQLEFPKILQKLKGYLNTPYGPRQLENLSLSRDRREVGRQLQEVREMMALLNSGETVPLNDFPDIYRQLEKCKPENSFLEGLELVGVGRCLQDMLELSRFFHRRREEAPTLQNYARGIHQHTEVVRHIFQKLDRRGDVLDNATPELRRIRSEIHSLEAGQKRLLQKLLKRFSEYSQDDIITLRDGRMVLGIQQQYVNKINGVVYGTSTSGATVFMEPMEAVSVSNEIQSLKVKERTEVIRILQSLTTELRAIRLDVEYGLENVACLDLILAKARLGVALQATVPQIIDETAFSFKRARHPLLILSIGHQNVVPLNLELGNKFSTLIITGPNAGGKTVALKTIGLLLLMVQAGLPIPADADSRIPLLPQILVDIGDRQSIEQDLSTFSAHILRLREILDRSDSRTLVLVDEIGTGTDPREGAALAIAILKVLLKKKALTVATTHHGELKAFAHSTPGIENASMEFDLKSLQPSYRIRIGVPGSSYAFEIAERYGLDQELLKEARRLVGQEKGTLEDLILNLENRIQTLERQERELSLKLSRAEGLQNLYERQVKQLEKEKKKRIQVAAKEAERIIHEARATVENTVKSIREQQASRESIVKAHQALKQAKDRLEMLEPQEEPAPQEAVRLKPGDPVRIRELGEEGVLLSLPDARGKARVQIGNVKMTLEISGLQKVSGKTAEKMPVHRISGSKIDDIVAPAILPELDLRGKDAVDALSETDKYLHEAIAAGYREVRIIHGKGTGVLRRKINEFLSRDSRVEEKRLGRWGEGDTGVTIVKLKVGQ